MFYISDKNMFFNVFTSHFDVFYNSANDRNLLTNALSVTFKQCLLRQNWNMTSQLTYELHYQNAGNQRMP